VRAERRALAVALALSACAARGVNSSRTEVRAGLRLSQPIGECVPRALGSIGDPDDLGRVTEPSVRYLKPLRDDPPAWLVRFFQSQGEVGPRFFDAVMDELPCRDGSFYLQISVIPFGVEAPPESSAIEPRLDALLAHVRATCRVTPLAEERAHTQNLSRNICDD
jgi:hypothetical protein